MKDIVCILGIIACILIVGYIEESMCHRGFDERLYELMVWFGWHLSLSSSKSFRITFPRSAMIRFCDEKCE